MRLWILRPWSLRLPGLLLALGLVASCGSQDSPSFLWKDAAGKSLVFSESLPRGRTQGSRLGPSLPSRLWTSPSPIKVKAPLSLELSFRAGPLAGQAGAVEVQLSLSSNKDGSSPFLKEVHHLVGPQDSFLVPLSPEKPILSLSLSLVSGASSAAKVEDGAWAVEILGIREVPRWMGFQKGPDGLRISSGVSVFRKAGEDHVVITDSSVPGASTWAPGMNVLVSYGPGGMGRSLQIISQDRAFMARLRPAGLSTAIPAELCGARGGRLELVLPKGVEARAFAIGTLPTEEAELADFGRILRSPPAKADTDYDLYRWDLLPSILIFDFRDYAVQDRYLRRLAFFVEKAGYRGKLMTDAELGSLHSWNAHDYRPEDLAAFFEAARLKNFPLNEAEISLRQLLLERGVLSLTGQAYAAGEGALISIARESPPYLRTMFLTHESTHGIFFVDKAYRDLVRNTWAAMDKEERWYWLLFLGWKEYDTTNSYLLANEYQAYLLQQVLPLVEDYFTKLQPSHVLENHKDLQPKMDAWMEEWKGSFLERASTLDAWMEDKYGFQAGRGAAY